MKIAMVGAGHVGAAIAVRLAAAEHEVVIGEKAVGSRSTATALARSPRLTAQPIVDAVAGAEVVFLATPFGVVESVLSPLRTSLRGKVLVDCTNPVGPGLSHGLRSERGGSEWVQSLVPETAVVKAFSIYGYENFEDPQFPGTDRKPAMLFCGDDGAAKDRVAALIRAVGFDAVDVGGLVQSLHLEHMTLLWVRMVRGGGRSPHFAWAALSR